MTEYKDARQAHATRREFDEAMQDKHWDLAVAIARANPGVATRSEWWLVWSHSSEGNS